MFRKTAVFCSVFAVTLFLLQRFEAPTLLVLACVAVAIALVSVILKKWKFGLALILTIVLAVGWLALYRSFDAPDSRFFNPTPAQVTLEATDFSYPANSGRGVWCSTKLILVDGRAPERNMKVLLFQGDPKLTLRPGDRISTTANLALLTDTEEFAEFTYYKTRWIDAQAFSTKEYDCTRVSKIPKRYIFREIAQSVKQRIFRLFDSDSAPIVCAVLTGDRENLSILQTEQLRVAGLSHVVAVSGMHLAILCGFFVLLLGKRRAKFVAIPAMIGCVLIIGATPSLLRAFLMQVLLLSATLFKREPDGLTSLSVALFLIVLANPYSIADVGLQLSFAATLGILLYARKLNSFFLQKFPVKQKIWRTVIGFFITAVSTTLCAMVFTIPILMSNFGVISVIAPLSNVLTYPAVMVLFIGSVLAVSLSYLWLGLGALLAVPTTWAARYFLSVTEHMARVPHACIYADNQYLIAFLVYAYLILIAVTVSNRKLVRVRVILPTLAVAVTACICFSALPNGTEVKGVVTSVLDVGQGLCVLTSGGDDRILVDCGGTRAGEVAYRALMRHENPSLDALVLTHLDQDHCNGVETLLAKVRVGCIYLTQQAYDSEKLERIRAVAQATDTPICIVSKPQEIEFSSFSMLLFPIQGGKENEVAVLFKHRDTELLITGDLNETGEKELVSQKLPDIEFYVAGHHGSRTSSSLQFLNAVTPEMAIVSVGEENRYGHPAPEILRRFELMGISVHRTDREGEICVSLSH